MTAPLRLLLAVAIVVASAVGGAAYAGRAASQDPVTVSDRSVTTLDFSQLIGNGDPDKHVIETAYEQLLHSYYERVNPQLLLNGESHALTAFVHTKAKSAPAVSGGTATGMPAHDLGLIESTVDRVAGEYPRVGTKAQFTDVAVSGMMGGLGDPYTTYLSANAIRALDEELQGR